MQTQPSEVKHTPLPWKFSDLGEGPRGKSLGIVITDAKGLPMFFLPRGAKSKANAELIVRACNSHYKLLEVLQECALLFEKGHAIDQFDWGKSALRGEDIRELNGLPRKIRAAIAEAEASR